MIYREFCNVVDYIMTTFVVTISFFTGWGIFDLHKKSKSNRGILIYIYIYIYMRNVDMHHAMFVKVGLMRAPLNKTIR